jgi:hypothetical protein
MSEREANLKELLNQLADELRSFRYILYSWKEELDNYRKAIMESSNTFIKLNITKDKQLEDERKVLEDHWLKQITTINLLGSEIGKLCNLVENKMLNVNTSLSTSLEKLDNNQSITAETLKKIVNEQVKTNGLLEDVKKLLEQQLEIRKQTALESAKLKKKIEKEIGE